jgi:DNA repair protein RecO
VEIKGDIGVGIDIGVDIGSSIKCRGRIVQKLKNINKTKQISRSDIFCAMQTKSQGILLQVIPYLGNGRILKVFTADAGLIALMAKKSSLAHFTPFCIAEWVYRKKQNEMFTLMEGSLIDSFLSLRQSYEALTAAGSIAQDLIHTQLPGRSSPGLYSLLSSYFKKILDFERPAVLAASFQVKLLLHEGLLALQSSCAYCDREAAFLSQGESVCPTHANAFAIGFSNSEWQILNRLAYARQFSLLQQIDCLPSLNEKISTLFEERTK